MELPEFMDNMVQCEHCGRFHMSAQCSNCAMAKYVKEHLSVINGLSHPQIDLIREYQVLAIKEQTAIELGTQVHVDMYKKFQEIALEFMESDEQVDVAVSLGEFQKMMTIEDLKVKEGVRRKLNEIKHNSAPLDVDRLMKLN